MTSSNDNRTNDERSSTENRQRSAQSARTAHATAAAGRREDYAWLREEQHHTIAQAADRLGVTYRTAQRWERLRRLRNEEAAS